MPASSPRPRMTLVDETAVPTRKLKRVEYDRLVEADVFGPEDRIELFDGRLIFKEPQYSPHATAVALVQRVLTAALGAVYRTLQPGGAFGLELVADLPAWEEYRKRMSLRGRRGRGGAHVTLVETVRQDPSRRLTIFEQEFTERLGRRRRIARFALTFRTLSVPQMVRRLEKAGFEITALLGDYRGGAWDPRAEVWMILAART